MARSPIETFEGPFEPAVALCERLQDLEAGRNDLLGYAVSLTATDGAAWDGSGA